MAWFARLLPKQQNSGRSAVQVGRAGGDVKVFHLTQHIYAPCAPVPSPAQPPHQHPPITPEPPSPKMSRPERRASPRPSSAMEQHNVLLLMQQLPDRIAVLVFMEREFDTRMVIHLDSQQLYRLRRYIEVILAARVGK